MSTRWYYWHDNATHGPISAAEMDDLIAQRRLREDDRVWPEGRDQKDAAPAHVVFDFIRVQPASAPIPDWLADVAAVETTGPASTPLANDETPEWLDDLRLWCGLDFYQPTSPSEPTSSTPSSPTEEIPDWLASFRTPEKPKTRVPTQAPTAPPTLAIPVAMPVSPPPSSKPALVAPPVPPSPPAAVPLASPIPCPVVREQPVQALPVAPQVPTALPIIGATPSVKPQSPGAVATSPAMPSPTIAPVKPSLSSFIVKKTRFESGFDLETGQIVDPEKFRQWKQQQAQSGQAGQPVINNAGLLDVFRKGRFAIESWADDDASRACIMQADIEGIKRRPEVQAIFREYANYGDALQEKLLRHLAFIVENRRKYFLAIEGARK